MTTKSSITQQKLINGYFQLYPDEAAKLLSDFREDEIIDYLKLQPIETAARLFANINPDISAGVAEKMSDDFFTELFSTIDPNLAARLVSRLDEEIIKKKLLLLPSNLNKELQELMSYPSDTAGHIIDTKATTFYAEDTVSQVLKRVRALKDRWIVNVYVIDTDDVLIGVIPLQHVAVSDLGETLSNLIPGKPIAINAMAPLEDVVKLMEEQRLINLPVIDIHNKLLGVIRYNTLVQTAKEDVTEDVQAMFGAGRDERALSKISFAIRKRLPWLEINLATAFLAATVVGLFEETIARITILAVFLPVVAGQSGNTGSQALAVTIRGLALREVRPRDWFKVARKEVSVGLINGVAVALTTALIVYFWADSSGLAIVIGTSMILSMVIAGLFGAIIPMVLQAFGQDPAQSSSIVLTTVTDVFGFLSFLGLATALATVLGIG
ncbi:MAG: magnesium transporter [Ignavibacteria bacterium]|nr:magnesium transporter [Ignavibacteria bacterium]MBT8381101.1 magnesium transporter [Ignavibacteria bacterium]NNL20464.1 magnesium transporter [Ignavibacteriaceae bacterium]